MTKFFGSDELVPPMPSMGMAVMERLGNATAELLGTNFSRGPCAIDVLRLADDVLPKMGIHVYPVSSTELRGDEGATDPSGGPSIDILVAEELYDQLGESGRRGNRSRSTLIHEFAHAVLHVPVIRRYRSQPNSDHLLRRVQRGQLKAYNDPEWQAWAFSGCLIAPRVVLNKCTGALVTELADAFGISQQFLDNHLKRLRMSTCRGRVQG